MAMPLTVKHFHSAVVLLLFTLLAGCTKKNREIRIAQEAPRKSSSYITEEGKVVRKWNDYRPLNRMSYEELAYEKRLLEINKDHDMLIKYIEQMIKVCANQDDLAALRLQLADLFFMEESYNKATENYDAYVDLYPGSPFADYAAYRSVLSRSKKLLTPDRDQKKTHEMIERCQKYLTQKVKQREYTAQVLELMHDAYYRLYLSEVITFYFYFNRGALLAAQKRIDYIKEHNLKDLPELAPEIKVLEYELAIASRDAQRAKTKQQELEKTLEGSQHPLSEDSQKHLDRARKQHESLAQPVEQADVTVLKNEAVTVTEEKKKPAKDQDTTEQSDISELVQARQEHTKRIEEQEKQAA